MPKGPLRGIDVSNNNGSVDWAAVAASGVQFAFAKATEGTGFRDPYFAANWAGIKANGIIRGAYHFARPDSNSALDEADYFLQMLRDCGGWQPNDVLVLDIENGSGFLGEWSVRFLFAVQSATGIIGWLYSNRYFIIDHGLNAASAYPLWLSAYQGYEPPVPPGWDRITCWQHTSGQTVPGVNDKCDESIWWPA